MLCRALCLLIVLQVVSTGNKGHQNNAHKNDAHPHKGHSNNDHQNKGHQNNGHHKKRDYDNDWKNFKKSFKKAYKKTEEEAKRRRIWERNVDMIDDHNNNFDLGHQTYRRGLNAFADTDHDEFVKQMCGYKYVKATHPTRIYKAAPDIELPATFDWRVQGIVTPVKMQGQCGSCYAFTATGALEAQYALKTGSLVSLSEQNLIDCSTPQGNTGCNGGVTDQAFDYIKQNGGIDTEDSYPYTGQEGTCSYQAINSGATCTGYVDITSGDEAALQQAVNTIGPIAVAIDGGQESFQQYQDGIYNEELCSNTSVNHGMLLVGYGTDDGVDYWLVKNSWGEDWGINGYVKMSRNLNNHCGIATQASYPLLCQEMVRLVGFDIDSTIRQNINNRAFIDKVSKKMKVGNASTEEVLKYLPKYFNDKWSFFIEQKETDPTCSLFTEDQEVSSLPPHPVIIVSDTECFIMGENVLLIDKLDFITALVCLLSIYYVCELAYNPKDIKTMLFIQTALAELQNTSRLPLRVQKLKNDILK